MEKPLYPSKNMRITQSYNVGTHIDSYAFDEAGADYNIEILRAPFTGIIKKIYPQDANEVWLESVEPVKYPDGTIDYMTIMFAHANNVNNLFVGKKINQNEPFYSEGTKGMATGNHVHIECGRGKFTGTGWHKNLGGYYSINNGKKPEECLWIDDSINIINNSNINFKKITETNKTEDVLPQPESSLENAQLIFKCPKKDLYGLYLEKDDELYLKKKKVD